MAIIRVNELPEGSGSLSNDDVFLFMDDPSGNGVTKKISLSDIASAIGGGGGGTSFQISTVDLHNGGVQNAQILQFDNASYQSVITGPTPAENSNAQRLIIQGQRGSGVYEGGDVYLWGGDSEASGGDIKIYAGDADSSESGYGGYINIDGGKGATTGGHVSITAGYSAGGQAGNVNIVGGATSSGTAGDVVVQTDNSNNWTFDSNGNLTVPGSVILPNNSTVASGTFNNGTGGNNGISLNCVVGYELNWQGGHLRSTADNGLTSANILVDSPLEFPGSGTTNMKIDPSGLTFPDGTTQNTSVGGLPTTCPMGSGFGPMPTDASICDIITATFTGNGMIENPTNPIDGKTLRWKISQDSTGGHIITLDTKFNIPSSASNPLPWSIGVNKTDLLAATYDLVRDQWDVIAFVPGY